MRKVLCVILAVLMISSLAVCFSGCDKTNSGEETSTEDSLRSDESEPTSVDIAEYFESASSLTE